MLIHILIHLREIPPVLLWCKWCSSCQAYQLVYKFHQSSWKTHYTGLRSKCKYCRNSHNRTYYRKNRKPKIKPKLVKKVISLVDLLKHREEVHARRKQRQRLWSKKDFKLHPEKTYKRKAKRRARLKNAIIVDDVNLEDIAIRDNWRCHLCGRKVTRKNWSIDHHFPVSQPGSIHGQQYVSLAHHTCNARRGNRKFPIQLRLLP